MNIINAIFVVAMMCATSCGIQPHNTREDCRRQCKESGKEKACYDFCDCIHDRGEPLNQCLDMYDNVSGDSVK